MRIDRQTLAAGMVVLLLCCAGCGGYTPITYDVASIVKDDTGTVTLDGSKATATIKENKAVGTFAAVGVRGGKSVKLTVAEVKESGLVFDVTYSDADIEQVEISVGETKDVFVGDGGAGVRVTVSR
jgi:hypothetical protein